MASAAIESEDARVKGGLGMAGGARRGGSLEAASGMAREAGCPSMGAGQREAGLTVVEGPIGPRRWSMTGSAVGAEASSVEIVVGVAAEAIARCSRPATLRVAPLTRDLRMAGLQREIDNRVVEGPIRPRRGAVAEVAVRPEPPLMLILGGVAADAAAGNPDPLSILVAPEAGRLEVARLQVETREGVVERRLPPGLEVVASTALVTQARGMNALVLVAADATMRCLP